MFDNHYFSDLDKFKKEPYFCNLNEINDLVIINYNKNKNNLSNKLNGLIYDKKNKKIIYYGLDKMNKDINELDKISDDYIVEELIDGVKIGVFYYNDKWNKCTNKKIYALNSIWHGPNFDELSEECFNKLDFSKLNTKCCYTFVIQHSKCLNYIKYTEPNFVLASCRLLDNSSQNYLNEINCDLDFPKPEKYNLSLEEIKNNLKNKNISGYILNINGYRYRLESNIFKKSVELKGNERNMKIRYLKIRNNTELKDDFMLFYPELLQLINEIEYDIKYLSKTILYQYINRFIKKQENIINPRFKKIIYEIHTNYINTREITTYEKVYNKVSNSDFKRIVFLLNTIKFN